MTAPASSPLTGDTTSTEPPRMEIPQARPEPDADKGSGAEFAAAGGEQRLVVPQATAEFAEPERFEIPQASPQD